MLENNFTNQQSQYDTIPQKPERNKKAIASIVCGIIGMCVFFTIFFGILFGIISMILAKQSARAYGPSVLAKIGRILGIAAIIVAIVYVLYSI